VVLKFANSQIAMTNGGTVNAAATHLMRLGFLLGNSRITTMPASGMNVM
jgi:hypothetical protein